MRATIREPVRPSEAVRRLAISWPTWGRLQKQPGFPRPVALYPGSTIRYVDWRAVLEYIDRNEEPAEATA